MEQDPQGLVGRAGDSVEDEGKEGAKDQLRMEHSLRFCYGSVT
jgi:hypothetical protein